jgi:polyphosphate kinase
MFNRELSWLEFNQRVLDEALDPENPLLERLKFFCIVSSNLDEFFEVRVAGLKQQMESEANERSVDGLTAGGNLSGHHAPGAQDGRAAIRLLARRKSSRAGENGIRILEVDDLTVRDQAGWRNITSPGAPGADAAGA